MHLIRAISFKLNGNTIRVECCKHKGGTFAVYTSINGHTQDVRHFDDYESAWATYTFLVDFGKDVMWAIPEEIKE